MSNSSSDRAKVALAAIGGVTLIAASIYAFSGSRNKTLSQEPQETIETSYEKIKTSNQEIVDDEIQSTWTNEHISLQSPTPSISDNTSLNSTPYTISAKKLKLLRDFEECKSRIAEAKNLDIRQRAVSELECLKSELAIEEREYIGKRQLERKTALAAAKQRISENKLSESLMQLSESTTTAVNEQKQEQSSDSGWFSFFSPIKADQAEVVSADTITTKTSLDELQLMQNTMDSTISEDLDSHHSRLHLDSKLSDENLSVQIEEKTKKDEESNVSMFSSFFGFSSPQSEKEVQPSTEETPPQIKIVNQIIKEKGLYLAKAKEEKEAKEAELYNLKNIRMKKEAEKVKSDDRDESRAPSPSLFLQAASAQLENDLHKFNNALDTRDKKLVKSKNGLNDSMAALSELLKSSTSSSEGNGLQTEIENSQLQFAPVAIKHILKIRYRNKELYQRSIERIGRMILRRIWDKRQKTLPYILVLNLLTGSNIFEEANVLTFGALPDIFVSIDSIATSGRCLSRHQSSITAQSLAEWNEKHLLTQEGQQGHIVLNVMSQGIFGLTGNFIGQAHIDLSHYSDIWHGAEVVANVGIQGVPSYTVYDDSGSPITEISGNYEGGGIVRMKLSLPPHQKSLCGWFIHVLTGVFATVTENYWIILHENTMYCYPSPFCGSKDLIRKIDRSQIMNIIQVDVDFASGKSSAIMLNLDNGETITLVWGDYSGYIKGIWLRALMTRWMFRDTVDVVEFASDVVIQSAESSALARNGDIVV